MKKKYFGVTVFLLTLCLCFASLPGLAVKADSRTEVLKDKAKKKDIIHFLVSKANIRESDIQGIDIKRKFTFVNINDKAIKKVMQHCQKEKLNG